jgi:hypothetical protein
LPTASSAHDVSSTSFAEPLEDTKSVLSVVPRIRSAFSRPSPLRSAVLSERVLKVTREDERGQATGGRTGVGTTVEQPAQSKHQIQIPGYQLARQDKARPLHPDRAVPLPAQPSHQVSSSKRNVASTSSHGQCDMNAVAPPLLKVSDSDSDIYFNDEDNDMLFAIEDSTMQGVAGTVGDAEGRVFDAGTSRDATSETSRGLGSTRPQVATSVSFIKPDHRPLD